MRDIDLSPGAANTVSVIVTDVGTFELPADIEARWDAARKRRNGRLDRRFKEGRALTAWEREFCRRAVENYIARA